MHRPHSGWAQRSPSGSPPLELVVSSLHHSEEIAFREQLDFMPHFYRHNKRKPTFNRTRGAAIGNATLTLPSLAHMPSEGARTSKCSQRCRQMASHNHDTSTTRPHGKRPRMSHRRRGSGFDARGGRVTQLPARPPRAGRRLIAPRGERLLAHRHGAAQCRLASLARPPR